MLKGKLPSIMGHLVELRKRLIILFIAVAMGMGIAWNFSPTLLTFLEKPLTGRTYLTTVKKILYQKVKERYPAFYDQYKLGKDGGPSPKERPLNYNTPLEPFFIQCKISIIAGFILALPVVFYQVWLFIAPGLTRREKRYVLPFVSVSSVSFCIGALFFLMFIWPVIINFSLSYEKEGLQSLFNLSAYINFCLRLILIFGLIFELPIISMLLSRLGIVSHGFLARNRKYAILASAVIAAFHADLITMFVIMVPLYLMYEVSVWVARIFGRSRTVLVPA